MTYVLRLYDALIADAATAALVGNRIYPLVRARGEILPALVYSSISAKPIDALGNTDYAYDVFSVSCDALTYSAAQTLADTVASALDGFKSLATSPYIFACRLDSRAETQENAGERAGATFRITLDFNIISKE